MKQVIVFPRGQLADKDKERLTKVGIVAVEADDPSKIVCLVPDGSLLKANDMLMAAMIAIGAHECSSLKANFVKNLLARMQANEIAQSKERT